MKRKLVKQGIRALTITVPSEWINKNNLKSGDEIDVSEVENSLMISTEKGPMLKEITVDVSGLLPRLADRFLARAYQKGYDKITIKYDEPEQMMAIKKKVTELMGFEILNIDKNTIEIQVISTQLDLDFDVLLRRGFLILMEMAETCEKAWKEGKKKELENLYLRDYEVNKFMYFCLRTLNKSHKMMTFGRSILYYLIESLEDLGDELKELAKLLANIPPDKEMLKMLGKMNEAFRISYEYFYKPEAKKAVEAFDLCKQVSEMVDNYFEKKSKDMAKALMSIEFSTRIIYHLTTMRLDTLKQLSGE